MTKEWDKVWVNASICTAAEGFSVIENAAIAIAGDKIAWIGKMTDLPDSSCAKTDVRGACITPGFIDCHTHLVFAGNRAHEYEMRLNGASYEEIARAGGGIQFTVQATRAASESELLEQSLPRAIALLQSGVTTVEVKSGYGLSLESEIKILRVAKEIERQLPISVITTFLGAHAVPQEFKDNQDKYIDVVCEEMIPRIAEEKLASAVDVFCENIAFTLHQTEKVFRAAQKYGLGIKCHAEQLSYMGSAELAADLNALSVDHLEHMTDVGVKHLAHSHTVAVLLPGAFYFLREKKLPPIEALRREKIPMAIASDCNPGTSPICSLLLILNMASTMFRLTPQEALLGVTKHAAQALGVSESRGTLAVGKRADFCVWDVKHPRELGYYLGVNPLQERIWNGISNAK